MKTGPSRESRTPNSETTTAPFHGSAPERRAPSPVAPGRRAQDSPWTTRPTRGSRLQRERRVPGERAGSPALWRQRSELHRQLAFFPPGTGPLCVGTWGHPQS